MFFKKKIYWAWIISITCLSCFDDVFDLHDLCHGKQLQAPYKCPLDGLDKTNKSLHANEECHYPCWKTVYMTEGFINHNSRVLKAKASDLIGAPVPCWLKGEKKLNRLETQNGFKKRDFYSNGWLVMDQRRSPLGPQSIAVNGSLTKLADVREMIWKCILQLVHFWRGFCLVVMDYVYFSIL